MIFRFYKYLYYRIYTWNLKTWGTSDLPQYNAMFGISFFMFLNISFLFGLMQINIGHYIKPDDNLYKLIVVLLGIMLFIINYFLFVNNKKYERIAIEFTNEASSKRKKNTILILLYITLSFALPIITAILYHHMHE